MQTTISTFLLSITNTPHSPKHTAHAPSTPCLLRPCLRHVHHILWTSQYVCVEHYMTCHQCHHKQFRFNSAAMWHHGQSITGCPSDWLLHFDSLDYWRHTLIWIIYILIKIIIIIQTYEAACIKAPVSHIVNFHTITMDELICGVSWCVYQYASCLQWPRSYIIARIHTHWEIT